LIFIIWDPKISPKKCKRSFNMDMTRDYPLCVGLVGVGYWGPNLLRTLMNNPEVRLKTVVDVSTERREYVISLHPNIQVVDKLDILLSDPEIEAVVIATPVHTHFKLAKCCLEAGTYFSREAVNINDE